MVTVLTFPAFTSLRNWEYERLVGDPWCTVGRVNQRANATMRPMGSSQCRQRGGGGGALPDAGLSPGGGGVACLLIGRTPSAGLAQARCPLSPGALPILRQAAIYPNTAGMPCLPMLVGLSGCAAVACARAIRAGRVRRTGHPSRAWPRRRGP